MATFNQTEAQKTAAEYEFQKAAENIREGLRRAGVDAGWELTSEEAGAIIDDRKFVTKDSGLREEFSTGARRDTQDGKPRYDLISVPALRRLAELMGRGAVKYGDRNWEQGMPISRFYASALRHLFEFGDPNGDRTEDHLAGVLFNVMAIMHFQEVDDLPDEIIDME